MKIINRKEFLKLPENTIFSKYESCSFGFLAIKGDSINSSNDFYYQDICDALLCDSSEEFFSILHKAEQDAGISIDMDFYCEGRDGLFDDNQLFAVWEEKDILGLIDRLKECIISFKK